MSLIGEYNNFILALTNRGWKAHKQVVRSLCCYGDATLLLTASRAVKMWSLADYSVVKVTSSHVVFTLVLFQ